MLYFRVPMLSNSWEDTEGERHGQKLLAGKLTLGVQRDCAVLELVEGRVVVLVDGQELLLQPLQLVFILRVLTDQLLQLVLEFGQIC